MAEDKVRQPGGEPVENKNKNIKVEKTVVNGMNVRTYTSTDRSTSVFEVKSQEQIDREIEEYEKKQIAEAEAKFREREKQMEQQMKEELLEENMEVNTVTLEEAARERQLDASKIADRLSKISKDDRIICIGDSITYGFEVEGSQTWIGRLRKEEQINLLNVGANGDTTEGMLGRFYEHVVQLKAKATVIMGGGNDIVGGTPLEYVTNNFAMMVQMAMDRGIVPIIGIEPEPNHSKVPQEWKTLVDYDAAVEKMHEYKNWLLQLAEMNALPCIDFDTKMKARLRAGYGRYFFDGIHPNPAGYKIMAAIAKEAFQEMGILPPDAPEPEDQRFAL